MQNVLVVSLNNPGLIEDTLYALNAEQPVKCPWTRDMPSIPGGHGASSLVVRILPWSLCESLFCATTLKNRGFRGHEKFWGKRMNMPWPSTHQVPSPKYFGHLRMDGENWDLENTLSTGKKLSLRVPSRKPNRRILDPFKERSISTCAAQKPDDADAVAIHGASCLKDLFIDGKNMVCKPGWLRWRHWVKVMVCYCRQSTCDLVTTWRTGSASFLPAFCTLPEGFTCFLTLLSTSFLCRC